MPANKCKNCNSHISNEDFCNQECEEEFFSIIESVELITMWCNTCGVDIEVTMETPSHEHQCKSCKQWWIDNTPKERNK